jgi:hypothetical protein
MNRQETLTETALDHGMRIKGLEASMLFLSVGVICLSIAIWRLDRGVS